MSEQYYPESYRRVRQSKAIRNLMKTVDVRPENLIQPYFVYQGLKESEELKAMYRQKKHTNDSLLKEVERGLENGVNTALLFFIPVSKAESHFDYSFDTEVIASLKKRFGDDLNVFTDMCLCSNTHTGHCGFLDSDGWVENHSSVLELARKSREYANAGADAICPSDMMDDRITAIRDSLDKSGNFKTLIMSYSTKFSSALYGPFREAAESAPSKGDRKSYQIDPSNENDALRCSIRDTEQGADMLMVKPAGMYLDIISKIKTNELTKHLPLAAYQVSGEYQSMYVCSQNGLYNFDQVLHESLVAIKRAGADLIISYAANDFVNYKK